jgi:hypothetical protein
MRTDNIAAEIVAMQRAIRDADDAAAGVLGDLKGDGRGRS